MKLISVLPLVALSTAFVLPDDVLFEQIAVLPKQPPKPFVDTKGDILSNLREGYRTSIAVGENALDRALSATDGILNKAKEYSSASLEAFDAQGWLDSASNLLDDIDPFAIGDHPHHPHHPPHHKKPHHGHCKSKRTVYELIASSKYTTKLAELINDDSELVQLLNGTSANFTVFAPTDKAFEKIPPHHEKPSKETIRKILNYHISSDFYPAKRVLLSHTIPTTLTEESLGGEPQRLRVGLGLKGLTVNFYSHIRAVNIFGTNGVIHGIDSILFPPPPALAIIALLPIEFSTLQLALTKTGLADDLAKGHRTGGTLFAPSNAAFRRLGHRVNAFLFSERGRDCLRALMQYHIVANRTLYADAYYREKAEADVSGGRALHVDLPTLLEGRSLAVDVVRYGCLINMRVNGYTDVVVQDGVAKDGVIQVPRNVLVPPRTPGGAAYMGEELSVEDFMSRFDLGSVEAEEERSLWDL